MQQDSQKHKELMSLIDSADNKEKECREYLQYVTEFLVADTPISIPYVEKELPGNSGDSDYVVSCRVCEGTGNKPVKAYVWELKAPQCYIFEKDNENRLRPTPELVRAENQLLHYHHEIQGSGQLLTYFKITSPEYVLLGGIIIGSGATTVKGSYEEEKKQRLYEKALMVRTKYFYQPHGIKILNWNYIADLLNPTAQPKLNPEPKEPVLVASKQLDIKSVFLQD
jgi:hypothetical protein